MLHGSLAGTFADIIPQQRKQCCDLPAKRPERHDGIQRPSGSKGRGSAGPGQARCSRKLLVRARDHAAWDWRLLLAARLMAERSASTPPSLPPALPRSRRAPHGLSAHSVDVRTLCMDNGPAAVGASPPTRVPASGDLAVQKGWAPGRLRVVPAGRRPGRLHSGPPRSAYATWCQTRASSRATTGRPGAARSARWVGEAVAEPGAGPQIGDPDLVVRAAAKQAGDLGRNRHADLGDESLTSPLLARQQAPGRALAVLAGARRGLPPQHERSSRNRCELRAVVGLAERDGAGTL